MPRRVVDPIVVPFTATVPAGTTKAAALTFDPQLPPGELQRIELQIPPGHSGATGIRFTYSGQQIVPWSNAIAWIIGDNLDVGLPIEFDIDGGLRVVAYNTGNFVHAFLLRFTIRQLPVSTAPPVLTLIDTTKLSQSG